MVLDDTCRWLSVEDSRREAAAPEWYLVQPPVCSSEQASNSFQDPWWDLFYRKLTLDIDLLA